MRIPSFEMRDGEETILVNESSERSFGSWLRSLPAAAEIGTAMVAILAVMSWIEFAGPAILDNDGYYHIRWAAMLREAAPELPAFQSLPLTTLNESDYADHHFLYHVLLIPFTLGDLRVGAKLAAAVYSSLGIVTLFSLLVLHRVPYRWLWLAPLVASSEPFLYRMSMTRAPSLSLVMMGLGIHLLFRRKLLLFGVLAFAFTWTYSLFPLALVLSIGYALTVYLAERRIDLWPTIAGGVGIAAGLVVNPYFPRNVRLFRDHLVMKLSANYSVDVGVEWYPYETWTILQGSAVAFALFLAGMLAFDFKNRDLKPLFFLFLSLVFLLMLFKSRRFIEYWPPFAILFAAFTASHLLERFGKLRIRRLRDRFIWSAVAASLVLAATATMGMVVLRARADVRSEMDPAAYQGASEWLAANAPITSRIFNTDWDDFPMLFYYNPTSEYIVGLDPTYLYDRDPELWRLYARITLGQQSDPATLIRESFGAEYVFTDNEHTAFLNTATESGDFETVYRDRYATVLRIRGPMEVTGDR